MTRQTAPENPLTSTTNTIPSNVPPPPPLHAGELLFDGEALHHLQPTNTHSSDRMAPRAATSISRGRRYNSTNRMTLPRTNLNPNQPQATQRRSPVKHQYSERRARALRRLQAPDNGACSWPCLLKAERVWVEGDQQSERRHQDHEELHRDQPVARRASARHQEHGGDAWPQPQVLHVLEIPATDDTLSHSRATAAAAAAAAPDMIPARHCRRHRRCNPLHSHRHRHRPLARAGTPSSWSTWLSLSTRAMVSWNLKIQRIVRVINVKIDEYMQVEN